MPGHDDKPHWLNCMTMMACSHLLQVLLAAATGGGGDFLLTTTPVMTAAPLAFTGWAIRRFQNCARVVSTVTYCNTISNTEDLVRQTTTDRHHYLVFANISIFVEVLQPTDCHSRHYLNIITRTTKWSLSFIDIFLSGWSTTYVVLPRIQADTSMSSFTYS